MSTVRDPTSIHWPEMIDNQEKNTIFLKPLVTSPKIEVGESPTTTATTTRMIRLCYCGERRWLRRKRRRLDEVGGLRLQASGRLPAVARWRSPRAIGAFDEALTIVSRVSASWDVRRVRARLRRLGVRRRPARIDRPKTGWEALTEAESMVASLAAHGCTSREIAEKLFISRMPTIAVNTVFTLHKDKGRAA